VLTITQAKAADSAVPTVPANEPAVIEVRGERGRISWDALRELWLYREVLWAFLVRSVKVRYKQASVGVGWAVLRPILAALVIGVVLGRLARLPAEGVPYVLFALAGMAVWTFFSETAASSMQSLVDNHQLLRKVYFPRETIPLAEVGAGLVDFAPALMTVGVVAALYGHLPSIQWIVLPIPVIIAAVTLAAIGLGLSALNVYYRDFRYVLTFSLQLAFFASPIIYPLTLIPASWRDLYAILNPVATVIDDIRRIMIHHQWPDPLINAGAFLWACLLLFLGYVVFRRLERQFADRV
jgi:lipopolysaccharide transport system permease protein